MDLVQQRFKSHLFFDMDGVLADFEGRLREITGTDALITSHEWEKLADKWSRTPGFFTDIKPIEGAIEAWHLLNKRYDCHILSTPAWENPHSWMEKRVWVLEVLGESAYKRLTLSNHKELFTGRALIDDRTKNGADGFNGEHIHFGTEKFPTWLSVTNHLLPPLYTWNG